MTFIGLAIWWLLQIFFFAMIIRFIADLVMAVNPSWKPNRFLIPFFDLSFTLTDPPLKFLRRFIKPIRLGGIGIDLAWTVLFFAVLIGQNIARSI